MAKTRSQAGNILIKKEDEGHKDIQILHSLNNTTKNNRKITKQKASKSKKNLASAQEIKVEENIDIKPLLKPSSALSTPRKTQHTSQEQIKQLIRYVVNDKIAISTAASKLKMRVGTAYDYFNVYKNDPEKKIPAPTTFKNFCTQEQITKLIKHIVDDGIPIAQASVLANMSCITGRNYYRQYLEDPNHGIPMQGLQKSKQDQIKKLIGYIVDDKMTLRDASKRANMGYRAGKKYYQKYLDNPNHDIPVPDPQSRFGPLCTQDQINGLISYIVNDKMTVAAASRKANIPTNTGWKYYRKYKNDPNHCIYIVGPKKRVHYGAMSQDKVKQLINYIVDDKMTIKAASIKAKVSYTSGIKYYKKYRNDLNPISTAPIQSAITPGYTQEQRNELIDFIVDDKMTVKDASEKAGMSLETGKKYYQQYLNDLYRDIPTPSHIASRRRCTEEQINTLIRCVIDDKMPLKAASKKANMHYATGIKYFQEYVNDPNNNTPTPDHIFRSFPQRPEQINALISYIIHDKMSILAASKKVKMGATAASKYYHQYVNDPSNDVPTHITYYPPCTQEQITTLIRCIVENKMTVKAASKKANMCTVTGHKYYNQLVRDRQ